MSHLSQNLEKLIQMISIEQLLGLVKQNNNNIKANTNTDVLSLPIVQKVVTAYEEEINILNTRMNTNFNSAACDSASGPATGPTCNIPHVKDYSEDIAKINDQLSSINNSLLQLSEAIKSISFNSTAKFTTEEISAKLINNEEISSKLINNEEHIQLKIEEIKAEELVASFRVAIEDSDDEPEISDLDEYVEEEVKVIKLESTSVVNLEAEGESEEVNEEEEEEESEKEISDSEEEDEEIEETEEVISNAESDSEEEVEEKTEEVISKAEIDSEEEEEEEEEEVFEIEIDDVTYYATSEENGNLYEVDTDGEVGKQVGVIKDGEPIFS